MMKLYDEPEVKPSPIPPSVVISSPQIQAKQLNPEKAPLSLKSLVMLVLVFTFASVMVGILLWILFHEYSRAHSKVSYIQLVARQM